MAESKQKPAISFYSKQTVPCPVCGTRIKKEEVLSGGGRFNAGSLTDELRRNYIPSPKFGPIYPFMYAVGTCPKCFLSLFWNDFALIDKQTIEKLKDLDGTLYPAANTIFPYADFTRFRTLLDGAASHYIALMCYDQLDKQYAPTIRMALISLRLAWLCAEMNTLADGYNFDYVQNQCYAKALFFYDRAVQSESDGSEKIVNLTSFGPDFDKNYGFDGAVYLSGVLEYKYGQTEDMQLRLKKMEWHKTALARMFGFGRSSKAKPGPFLEIARSMYEKYVKLLSEANSAAEIPKL